MSALPFDRVTIPGDGPGHLDVVVDARQSVLGREVVLNKATITEAGKLRHLSLVLTVLAEWLEAGKAVAR